MKTNGASGVRRIDRLFGYFALFLIGLIGWVCDRLPTKPTAHLPVGESRC